MTAIRAEAKWRRKALKKDTDIKVLGSGFWCPDIKSVFPNKCTHGSHDLNDSVRCLVVNYDSEYSGENCPPRKRTETITDKMRQFEAACKIVGHVFHGCPTECGRCAKVDEMASILAARDAEKDREIAELRKLYEAEKEARIKAWRDAEQAEAAATQHAKYRIDAEAALAAMTKERDGLLTQIVYERNEIRVRQRLLDEAVGKLAADPATKENK